MLFLLRDNEIVEILFAVNSAATVHCEMKACFVEQGQAKIASLFWCLNLHSQFCFLLLVCMTIAEETELRAHGVVSNLPVLLKCQI